MVSLRRFPSRVCALPVHMTEKIIIYRRRVLVVSYCVMLAGFGPSLRSASAIVVDARVHPPPTALATPRCASVCPLENVWRPVQGN